VATFRGTDATPKEVFVHHNAGLSGFGGSSYIDAVIFRDRDASTSWWEDAADGLREERIYYVQNWRADVSALLTDTGSLIQWVKYSAYGVPFMIPSGDIDSDGDFDLTDVGGLGGGTFTDRARQDVNLDGVSDFDDVLDALALHGSGTFGWGTLSAPQTASRRGYAGYEYDPVPEPQGRRLYHVRHRVYDADSGRWTRRDPLGYIDGVSLYRYVANSPLQYNDSLGQYMQDTAVAPQPAPRIERYNNCISMCRRLGLGSRCTSDCNQWFYDANVWLCRRDLDKRGTSPADRLIIWIADDLEDHGYLSCSELPSPETGFSLPGERIRKGDLPQPEKAFPGAASSCWGCERTVGTLLYGKGKGKNGLDATPEDIADCIRNRRASKDYHFLEYNCNDWTAEAANDCGIACNGSYNRHIQRPWTCR
jgi:RHS repeat-associated protein